MSTVRFRIDAAEQIVVGVLQQQRAPVNLIQPALQEMLKMLYSNGLFLAGDDRYPTVQQLIPQGQRAAPQGPPQHAQQPPPQPQYYPQAAPQQLPPQRAMPQQVPQYYQPQAPQPQQLQYPQAPQQAAMPQFQVPGMQPPGVGFPPPPMGMPPPPPNMPPQLGQPSVPSGHPASMTPIQPATWAGQGGQGQPPAAPSNPGLTSQGPHAVPLNAPMYAPSLPEIGPVAGPVAAPAPAVRSAPNVVTGPFPTPSL